MALKRKVALVAAVLTLGGGAGAAYAATSGGSTPSAGTGSTSKPAPSTQHHCPHMNAGVGY
jgi:hypothetical protein